MFDLSQLVVWMLISRCLAQDAAIISGPTNFAALAEHTETVRFDCSAEVGSDTLEWRWFPVLGESGQRMWISGNPIKPEYLDLTQPTRFPTTHLADNSRHEIEIYKNNFNLIINSVSTDDAGTYACKLLVKGADSYAYLVFVQGFSCGSGRPNASNVDVAEGDTMPLVCSVKSYGQVAPTLNWTRESDTDISAVYGVDGENVSSSAEMIATVQLNQKPFTCHLSFQPHESQRPDSEPATYSDSCVFSYNVWYKPRNVQTSREATSVDGILRLIPGDTVSCSSSGNPQPINFWFKQITDEVQGQVKDPVLTITANMISSTPVPWVCRGMNSFNGWKYKNDVLLTILVSSPPTTTPTLTQPPRTTTRLPPQPMPQPTLQPKPQPTPQPTLQPTPAASSTAESLPNSNAQAQTDGGGGNGAVIGGAVAGVLVVIILIVAAAYFFISKRRGKDVEKEDIVTPRVSS